jgi:quercetin dioxygenase-like cupin family protein
MPINAVSAASAQRKDEGVNALRIIPAKEIEPMVRTSRVAVLVALTTVCTAYAQQGAAPTPAPAAPQRGVLGPAPNFTGNTTTLDTTGYTIGRRVFAAGARNATWHMHSAGQLVFGEAGRGRFQLQGQPIKELGVGDSAYIPGGAFHWHGAAPNENFTMVFVTMGQSKTSQGDPVTDAVYLGNK